MLHSLLKVKNVGPNFLRAQNPRRYIYCYSNLVYSTSRFDNCAAAALRWKKLWDLTQSRLLNSTPWAYRNLKMKWKMAAIIFVKKVLSTRSPKLRLTCRRKLSKKCTFTMYFSNYLGWRCRVFINSDLRLCTWLWMRFFCHTQWLQNNKGLIRSLTKPNHWGTDEATGSDTSLLIWIKPMTVL